MGRCVVEQTCEICGGEIRYGFCQSCGLLAEDYYPQEDIEEEELDEQEDEQEDMRQKPSYH